MPPSRFHVAGQPVVLSNMKDKPCQNAQECVLTSTSHDEHCHCDGCINGDVNYLNGRMSDRCAVSRQGDVCASRSRCGERERSTPMVIAPSLCTLLTTQQQSVSFEKIPISLRQDPEMLPLVRSTRIFYRTDRFFTRSPFP